MPSSLIIVALAAAWLVVLVPMIARKRQEIARTTDSALAARVVRSGSARAAERGEFAMSETGKPEAEDDDLADPEDLEAELDAELEELEAELDEPAPARPPREEREGSRRYRPGRGGFDPEAAEIAARAKYVHRQRVVLGLIIAAIVSAVVAGFVWSTAWWAHGAIDAGLVCYLGYLRRQVRIEDGIRERRLARYNGGGAEPARPGRRAPESDDGHPDDVEVVAESRRELVGSERKPSPTSRLRRQAVVVDLDDEDPAFHELDEPGQQSFRRASGE
ncbi:gephyrin-like molybdotransferase receptor GlpR [Amycolatopsis nigrescens]|uniref:divisome protein SepX/GlpR n=1 Tax=Amycolatopsis nigrescens TaxID=381445 RepID=UPI0003615561|nr:gephyrin-like molybdotransferase receptor GlpR [Amycolatopsis nigrescens]